MSLSLMGQLSPYFFLYFYALTIYNIICYK
nr:MAG TPA: hypothetical protein [Caudoviricetes sp.]